MSALTKVSRFPTKPQLFEVFSHLTRGDAATFYKHYVADNVSWTVMGSHALSKTYNDKETFLKTSVARIGAVLDGPIKLHINSVIGGEVEEWAVIEMAAEAKCKNGMVYDNTYSWSTRWEEGKIVEVRAYLDGLLLNRALAENEKIE